MQENSEKVKDTKKIKIIFFILLTVIAILGIAYISYRLYDNYKAKKDNTNILDNVKIDDEEIIKAEIEENKTERILQLEKLQKINEEIVGWLEIEGTNINYPVLQTNNNDYYLTHNYKKEQSSTGSIFLDKNFDFINGSSNYLIYGHRNENGLMFEDLMKYANEDFYKEHTKIKFTTNKEDSVYEVLAVFYSRVYYKSEQNVFRYYYFVNANNEQEYNEFVNNAKNVSIYDTGVTANYGDQLLTLSTCEYSQEDGRFAIVCKKIDDAQ